MSKNSKSDIKPFIFYGFDLTSWKTQNRLIFLSFSYIVCSLLFSILQERVYKIPGFKYGGFMTILTSVTYVFCSALEIMATKEFSFNSGVLNFVFLAITTFSGMYFTNWSLQYISFPVRIIFKSSKLVPVMIVSLLMGRKMTLKQFGKNCSLVCGLVLFILADSQQNTKGTSLYGLGLITVSVFADALTSNFEEHVFLKKHKVPRAAIICFTNLISIVYSVAISGFTGELTKAFEHSRVYPETVALIVAFSAVNYFSVSFVLMIIEQFGSTEAEVAKTVRKFLSIVLSFAIFSNPLSLLHVIGGVIFFVSLMEGVASKAKMKRRGLKTI